MKKRIEQLLNGIYEYEPVKLILDPQEITLSGVPGAVLRGVIRIEAADGKKVKGFLYSSNPRAVCDPVEFQGLKNDIHYQIDCNGIEAGELEEGTFTVSSDHGEYTVPFSVRMEKKNADAGKLPFADLQGFARLAEKNYEGAYRYFISGAFREFLETQDESVQALYDGLGTPSFGYECMEEFLVGTGCKDALCFSADETSRDWGELSEPVRETIRISRNTWGFHKISIESDAKFLRPEKRVIGTDEFAGSTYDLNFVLDTNLMHAGNNYARLRLKTTRQTMEIEMTVRKAGARKKVRQKHICRIMTKKLESLYVDFRLKKTDLPTWVERSVSVINSYRRAGGDDPFAELFLIQLYFADGKKQKAYSLLEMLEAQKSRLDTVDRYGFYLYMSTFFYREASYVDRVEDEITKMFCRDKTNWKLQWILFYLQESFLNDENARYEAVAEQFRYGCRSRIMYVEAYQILKKNPFLMRHLGNFELQLLRFAAKEEILTAEVIRQVANLAVHYGHFDQRLYEILSAGYRLYPSADLVKAICILLIQGGKRESCYFPWYEKGVECGLRITGLYEYYMETMDCVDLQEMPQIIRMYFAYDNTLDYRKRAAIYRRILENRENDGQTWRTYRPAMEKFAADQLEYMRISDDLAVLYRGFLRKESLTRSMTEKLARLLFTYEVESHTPEMRRIVIHSPRMTEEQTAVLQDGKAYIQIYDPDSVLLAENQDGERSLTEELCTVRKVFDSEKMLSWCTELAPDFPGIVLYIGTQCHKAGLVNDKTLPYFRKACETRELSERFRTELRRDVLRYYTGHLRDESLPEFLENISYQEYVAVDKTALITLLAEEGKCTDAFTLLDAYGSEGIPLLQLVRICSRMVLELEFEENSMLVSLCYYCFNSGKYDDKLLRYLTLYYEGPVKEMEQVWQAARKFELDTMLLEEKILMMILFTRSETQGSEPVFESYVSKMGRKKLCRAYVNLKAYEYFVKGVPVADSVFRYIERGYISLSRKGRLDEQEEVCRLALLQYYAKLSSMTDVQRKCASRMLEEFSAKGMRFAFWQCFDKELLAPYQMEGRVFVEYVCNPESIVSVYYRPKGSEEEYTKELVKNYFGGIFVKEFTLFYGEELECYLEEELPDGKNRTDQRILKAPDRAEDENTRYEMLNRISRARESGDQEKVQEEMESYLLLEYLAKELFTLV
ncbi:MAG: DUF5717 family protein [Candidatus Choladocola sp.]|nr:DUF5717 family protein [Candidatus Choladocola sp.]